MSDEIVKIELKFHTICTRIYMWTHALSKKGYIYFCTFCALFCELSADFHAKESLTFSRKIRRRRRRRRVVRVVCARSRHERRKESLLLVLARAL